MFRHTQTCTYSNYIFIRRLYKGKVCQLPLFIYFKLTTKKTNIRFIQQLNYRSKVPPEQKGENITVISIAVTFLSRVLWNYANNALFFLFISCSSFALPEHRSVSENHLSHFQGKLLTSSSYIASHVLFQTWVAVSLN